MKLIRFALIAITFLSVLSSQATDFAPFGETHHLTKLSTGEYVVYKDKNPYNFSENGTKKLNDCYLDFSSPKITLKYTPTPVISGNKSRLTAALKRIKSPKIILRVPEQCKDAKFVETIETKLASLGLNVLDHNMTGGAVNPTEIRKNSGADILLDVSWLKFSDPEMFTTLDKTATELGEIRFSHIGFIFYKFPSIDAARNYIKKSQRKNGWQDYYDWDNKGLDLTECYYDFIKSNISDGISQSECFEKNKNVISAIFKFIDLTDGSLLGFYHLGHQEQTVDIKPAKIIKSGIWKLGEVSNFKNEYGLWYKFGDNSKWRTPWDIENNATYEGTEPAAMVLTYLSGMANIGEIPYAAKLNDFQDVKISDEQVQESSQSNSNTQGSTYGNGATYYHRYFDSSYYSGSSRSNTSTSSSSTTTYKEAEYLRCSDFYGYYTPLADKLVAELRKLLE